MLETVTFLDVSKYYFSSIKCCCSDYRAIVNNATFNSNVVNRCLIYILHMTKAFINFNCFNNCIKFNVRQNSVVLKCSHFFKDISI